MISNIAEDSKDSELEKLKKVCKKVSHRVTEVIKEIVKEIDQNCGAKANEKLFKRT